ncbi:MAG TPA: hypothetical protein VMT12_02905 [Syntrophales bacterium]|nr:hypothetical protein [Syntrophales bacterium]
MKKFEYIVITFALCIISIFGGIVIESSLHKFDVELFDASKWEHKLYKDLLQEKMQYHGIDVKSKLLGGDAAMIWYEDGQWWYMDAKTKEKKMFIKRLKTKKIGV